MFFSIKNATYHVSMLSLILSVFLGDVIYAKTIYVNTNSVSANDTNIGSETAPLKTVQKALETAQSDDVILIKAGEYDLNQYARQINIPLTITGENVDTTVLKNGKTFYITKPINISNVSFSEFSKPVFYLTSTGDNIIDGISITNCRFTKVQTGIYSLSTLAGVRNVSINNCEFNEMAGEGVTGIRISHGQISNVTVSYNRFKNLEASDRGSIGVMIGDNAVRATTTNVKIFNNTFERIHGATTVIDDAGQETHAILAYGSYIDIHDNNISDLNAGQDHEAIYIKASNSVIRNNILKDVGSGAGGGDLAVKGQENVNNEVYGNIIISDLTGRATYIDGGATIHSNYIKNTNSSGGYFSYFKRNINIINNTIISYSSCVYLGNGLGATITGNTFVSLHSGAIAGPGNIETITSDNTECTGYGCTLPPLPDELRSSTPVNLKLVQ